MSHLSVNNSMTRGSATAARPAMAGKTRNALVTSALRMICFTMGLLSWFLAYAGNMTAWIELSMFETSTFGNSFPFV